MKRVVVEIFFYPSSTHGPFGIFALVNRLLMFPTSRRGPVYRDRLFLPIFSSPYPLIRRDLYSVERWLEMSNEATTVPEIDLWRSQNLVCRDPNNSIGPNAWLKSTNVDYLMFLNVGVLSGGNRGNLRSFRVRVEFVMPFTQRFLSYSGKLVSLF